MFYDILDNQRKDVLPKLLRFKDRFYLAGGTALALQIGHRDSIDFDFFTKDEFDTAALFAEILEVFGGNSVLKTQEERNTLSILVYGEIKISFFTYKYELVKPLLSEEYIAIASVEDIACMKCSAITGRALWKDYLDLYFILHVMQLNDIFSYLQKKMPDLDINLVRKSLVYFDDVEYEPIIFKNENKVTHEQVKDFLNLSLSVA